VKGHRSVERRWALAKRSSIVAAVTCLVTGAWMIFDRFKDSTLQALEELRVFAEGRRGSLVYDAQVLVGLGKNEPAIEKLQWAVEEYPPTVIC
jgi:hypothetical protein